MTTSDEEMKQLAENVSDDVKTRNPQIFGEQPIRHYPEALKVSLDSPTATTEPLKRRKGTSGKVKRNKYGVAPKEDRTYNGIVYHSKKEAKKAAELDLLVKAGEIDFWCRQVPFILPGGDTYVADFVTFLKVIGKTYKGETEIFWTIKIIEIKGIWTPLARNKFKRFKQAYPNFIIEVV